MAEQATLALVLAFFQVALIRLTQYAIPQYYFSTGALFERRAEVTVGAILFRLAIPFTVGLVVPILVDDHEFAIAAGSGIVAWFLVLWPIAWNPTYMLPQSRQGYIVLLLLLFWVPFAALPLGGVEIANGITAIIEDSGNPWGQLVVGTLVTFAPALLLTAFAKRLVNAKVGFVDDEPEWPEDDVEDEYKSRWVDVVRARSPIVPILLAALAATGALVVWRRRDP